MYLRWLLLLLSSICCCSGKQRQGTFISQETTMGQEQEKALECGVFLAPSSIPGAGLGMFAGLDYQYGQQVTFGDIIIPLVELNWHNDNFGKEEEEEAEEAKEVQQEEAKTEEEGDNNGLFSDGRLFWLWDEYTWSYTMVPEMEMETESSDLDAASPGIGAAMNCLFPRNNVADTPVQVDNAGLHRSKDPGSGAFTPYHGRTSWATRDILAGEELFVDYGENYFTSREHIYGKMPFVHHYSVADDLLLKLQSLLSTHAPQFKYNDNVNNNNSTLWHSLYDIIKSMDTRLTNAFPPTLADIDSTLQNGGTIHQFDQRSRKSVDWLNRQGTCMDHLQTGSSTIPQAGRGVFAYRYLPKGTIVAPVPLIHIPNRTVLNMYNEKTTQNGEIRRDESKQVHSQLLLNYCYGHPESSVLLSPYGMLVNLINHSPNNKRANVKLQWSTKLSQHFEWTQQDPMKMMQQWHTGLVMELVALRNIFPGEEILLDYGPAWEKAWKRHVKHWKPKSTLYRASYEVNAAQLDEIILQMPHEGGTASGEAQEHLTLWIHGDYRSLQPGRHVLGHEYCRAMILYRYIYRGQTLYTVQTFFTNEIQTRNGMKTLIYNDVILWAVPRDAFIFDDVAYTRDHQQRWSFRHEIHIPDDVFPEAWKNMKKK